MKLESFAALSATISSSLGSFNCLSGTTLAFAIMKDMLPSTYKNAIAPYAKTGISKNVKLTGLLSYITLWKVGIGLTYSHS